MNDWVKAVVTRDAVCVTDAAAARRMELKLHAGESVGRLIRSLWHAGFLPPLPGGEATWVLYLGRRPVCVVAQQDSKERYIADPHATLGEIPRAELLEARLRYLAQRDPDQVHRYLCLGREVELT